MQAIVCERFGQAPVIRSMPDPVPGRGQVRVRQHFSSINAGDELMNAGRPIAFRPVFAAMLRPPILGRDVAGVIDAVGPGVEGLQVGDRVMGEAGGAWAEKVLLGVDALAVVPDGVQLRDAAALPVSGLTALQGLAEVRQGSEVLVVGASGNVGHLAVQIAADRGARVTGVCSARNVEFVRSLGAASVLDYETTDFTDRTDAWDVVFDLAGTASIGACVARLRPGGTYVSSAGSNGGPWLGPLPRLLAAALRSVFDRRVRVLTVTPDPTDLQALLELVREGRLSPRSEVLPLDEVPQAMAGTRRAGAGKQVVGFVGESDDDARMVRASMG